MGLLLGSGQDVTAVFKNLLQAVLTFNEQHVPFQFGTHGREYNNSAEGVLANFSSSVQRAAHYSEASALESQLSELCASVVRILFCHVRGVWLCKQKLL